MNTATPLETAIREQLDRYFDDLGQSQAHDMLAMVSHCVEKTVIKVALEKTANNQSRAAEMLGITRGTLRKKIQAHAIQI